MWSTSNCARPLQKCHAPVAYLVGQKALYTVVVEFACVTRNPCASWIENDSIPYRFRITWFKKESLHGARREKLRSRPTITKRFNAWKRCRKQKDAAGQKLHQNSREIFEGFAVPSITKRNWMEWSKCKEMDKMAREDHCYTLTKSDLIRYSSIVLSVVISICVIELSVPVFHIVVLILLIVIL